MLENDSLFFILNSYSIQSYLFTCLMVQPFFSPLDWHYLCVYLLSPIRLLNIMKEKFTHTLFCILHNDQYITLYKVSTYFGRINDVDLEMILDRWIGGQVDLGKRRREQSIIIGLGNKKHKIRLAAQFQDLFLEFRVHKRMGQ